ncbi:MAG: type III-A CRISPR-associated RAMP protein Csm3 [Bryobacterales bacterium]|nr:type III-A CRISPR-associated RAMP protein Csm3 [Bryobacteraceae bacterium]MDW8355781.1 type III-A CRISPR-associated RAMP protein Csm3 [Bryobacterales bacterium]
MSAAIEYRKSHCLTGTIEVLTGLRIGAGKETIEIGGLDNPVIKHPHTGHPYIPGSSLKGKLRSLMEWAMNRIEPNGAVWGAKTVRPGDEILRIFGVTNDDWKDGPSRLIVRDAFLDPSWVQGKIDEGLPLTEEKTEVVIDRIQGKAASGIGPRRMERVPAGAKFHFEMIFKIFSVNGDDGELDRRCLELLVQTMKLLEQDALGGSGSRGYGKVRFVDLQLDGKPIQDKFDAIRSWENPPNLGLPLEG